MVKCPAKDCRATGRVDSLSPQQIEEIGEDWANSAYRCTYCGTVFNRDSAGGTGIRGWYDDPMGEQGWTPRA